MSEDSGKTVSDESNPKKEDIKEEVFTNFTVSVVDDGTDLYDGLSRCFYDIVDVKEGKARREVSLLTLPPLVQIQLSVRL